MVLAQDEARALKHNFIGTEHLLLGLMREEEGIAARVLESFEVTTEEIRAAVARTIGQGEEVGAGQIPFTPRAKRVLELSLRQAVTLRHQHIGTEHLLLALLHEGGGVAIMVLQNLGAEPDEVWNAVFRMLDAEPPARAPLNQPPSERRTRRSVRVSSTITPVYLPRWASLYDWWPPMILGAGLFGGGLLVGWLIWG